MEDVVAFVDWLYETCPVNPDEVTRERLLELYRESLVEGDA